MTNLDDAIIKAITEWLNELKQWIDAKTPENTQKLLGNNQIQWVIKRGNVYYGRVFNDTEYAKYVEHGVKWKKYRYQKPKGNKWFYTGVGARMYARTVMEKQTEIINKIKSAINQQIVLFNKSKPWTRSI